MDNTADFEVRIASPQDAEAVSALLAASYPLLMAFGYDPILFARALPVLSVDQGKPSAPLHPHLVCG